MSHLSDKELDRLSREAAEQFDVEGSTSGWDALEKKLDTSMPAEAPIKRRRGLWFWLTGSLLLIGLLGYYFFSDKGNPHSDDAKQTGLPGQKNQAFVSSENSKPVPPGTKEGLQSHTGTSKIENENSDETILSGNEIESRLNTTQPDRSITKSASGDRENLPKESELETSITQKRNSTNRPKNNLTKEVSSLSESTQNNRKSSTAPDSQNRTSLIANKETVEGSSDGFKNSTNHSDPDFIRQTNLHGIDHDHYAISINRSTRADSMIALLFNAAVPERDTSVKPKTIFPIEVGMLVGSDMSNVNFQGSDRMGLNFGISVGYRFNKRWQINTGLIHTKKYYEARGKDFHPPKGYWTDYVKLDLVAGNCSMWEIPLNVRYDLSLTRRGSWFISGGLSTYLMQQEDYDYHYWSNGSFYTRHKGYPSSEKSILGILNLSGGFEKNFTPHVSVQIEPYLRIPLKGVGFGNMQMNSFGTNFILKFKSGPAKN